MGEETFLFVEQPPADFFCPMTNGLLLQPHLTSCCGNHLSEEAVLNTKKACSLCKDPGWKTMLNKHFQRQVNSLHVFCRHKDRGCGWQGELAAFHHHVESCPMRESPRRKKQLTLKSKIIVTGVPLLTEQCFVYTGKHMEFIWEEAGISLHFPDASCERDIRVSVEILTNIEGNCILPKGYRLMPAASATYKITASAHFPAPVRLRMEHCAVIEKEYSLVYMVTPCSTPYNFKAVSKGKFNESHGEIEIKHFSVWKIFYNTPYLSKSLAIQVVYLSNRCIHIVVTKKTAVYRTAIREEYPNAKNIEEHLMRCIFFTSKIAFESEIIDDGWNIKLDPTPASINMTDIHEYEPGDTVPSVKVRLEWKGDGDQQEGDIQIKVQGGDIESFSLHCKPDQMDQSLEHQTTAQSTPGSSATPYIPPESTSLSVESRALRRSNFVFNSGVDPDYLITYLYSKFLLTPSEKSRAMEVATSEKPEKIFTTMERRVSVRPEYFQTLLQALQDEPAMRGLWEQMKGNQSSIATLL